MTEALSAMYAAAGKFKGASKQFGPMLADACRRASKETTINEMFKAVNQLVKQNKLEAKEGDEGRFSYRRTSPSKHDDERHPDADRLAALPRKPVLRKTTRVLPQEKDHMSLYQDETPTATTVAEPKEKAMKTVAKKTTKKVAVKTTASKKVVATKDKKPSRNSMIRDLFAKKQTVTLAELAKTTGYKPGVVHTAMAILKDERRTKADRLLVTMYDRESQSFKLQKVNAAAKPVSKKKTSKKKTSKK